MWAVCQTEGTRVSSSTILFFASNAAFKSFDDTYMPPCNEKFGLSLFLLIRIAQVLAGL